MTITLMDDKIDSGREHEPHIAIATIQHATRAKSHVIEFDCGTCHAWRVETVTIYVIVPSVVQITISQV